MIFYITLVASDVVINNYNIIITRNCKLGFTFWKISPTCTCTLKCRVEVNHDFAIVVIVVVKEKHCDFWNEYVTIAVNRNLSNCENSPKKRFSGLQQDSNPWPLR